MALPLNVQLLKGVMNDQPADIAALVRDAISSGSTAGLAGLEIDKLANLFIDVWNKYGKQVTYDLMGGWENPLTRHFLRDANSIGEFTEILTLDNDPTRGVQDYQLDDGSGNNPFLVIKPVVKSDVYGISERKVWYRSVTEPEMRRAFISPTGLSALMSMIIDELRKNANIWLFNYAQDYLVSLTLSYAISPVSLGDDAGNRKAYAQLLNLMSVLRNPTRDYNEAGFTSFLNSSQALCIFNTNVKSAFDVSVLASLFHSERIGEDNFGEVDSVAFSNKESEDTLAYLVDKRKINFEIALNQTLPAVNPKNSMTTYWHHLWLKAGIVSSMIGFKIQDTIAAPVAVKSSDGKKIEVTKPTINSAVYWTDDGSDPTVSSHLWDGQPVARTASKDYKFKAFPQGKWIADLEPSATVTVAKSA